MSENEVTMCLHLVYASNEVDEAIRLCEDVQLASALGTISEILHGAAYLRMEDEKEKNPPAEANG